jgi:8-oxo-dGTP pyrophosphatase MutT (NUDIX family)
VPVRGAILLDPTMTKCLLVRGFKRDAGWGFPRGKMSLGESDAECAAREVLEETGYDIGGGVREDQFVDVQLGDQATRLFIVPVSCCCLRGDHLC